MSSLLEMPPLPLLHIVNAPGPLPQAPPKLPEIPFVLDDNGTFLDLPPIGGPVEANLPRIANATNPGTTKPQDQGFRIATVDQTRSVTPSTVPWRNSDGQVQLKDLHAGEKGVTVTREIAPLMNSDGNFQTPNFQPIDGGISADQRPGGLPLEARPDSQNVVKLSKVYADQLPVAVTINADTGRPGGLARSHIIK